VLEITEAREKAELLHHRDSRVNREKTTLVSAYSVASVVKTSAPSLASAISAAS
jgi:hypothetical protein